MSHYFKKLKLKTVQHFKAIFIYLIAISDRISENRVATLRRNI